MGLALVSSACGKQASLTDGPLGIDASAADATAVIADASPDADVHGAVTVTVISRDGGPMKGAAVVFTDAEGTQEKIAGDDGKTSATVLPGATVTAVSASDTLRYVDSVAGVKPGDDLVLGTAYNEPQIGTFNVDLGFLDSGDTVAVYGPCDSSIALGPKPQLAAGGQTVQLTMHPSCKQDTMDLLFVRNRSASHLKERCGTRALCASPTTAPSDWRLRTSRECCSSPPLNSPAPRLKAVRDRCSSIVFPLATTTTGSSPTKFNPRSASRKSRPTSSPKPIG